MLRRKLVFGSMRALNLPKTTSTFLNNNDNMQQFMNELDPVLTKLDRGNKDILLAGDFNINLLKINERELFADLKH